MFRNPLMTGNNNERVRLQKEEDDQIMWIIEINEISLSYRKLIDIHRSSTTMISCSLS